MKNILSYAITAPVYLLVFFLPLLFLPFTFESFEFNKQILLFALVSLAFFAWIAKTFLIDKEIRFRRSILDVLIVAFAVFFIISGIFTVDIPSTIFGSFGTFSNSLISLLMVIIIYFLISYNASFKKARKRNQEEEANEPLFNLENIVSVFLASYFFVLVSFFFSLFNVWKIIAEHVPLPGVMLNNTFNTVSLGGEGLAVLASVLSVFLLSELLTSKNGLRRVLSLVLLVASLILIGFVDFFGSWMVLLAGLAFFVAVSMRRQIFKENINVLILPLLLIVLSLAFLLTSINLTEFLLGYNLDSEPLLSYGESLKIGLNSVTSNVNADLLGLGPDQIEPGLNENGIKAGILGSGPGTFHYDFSRFRSPEMNMSSYWQARFDHAGNYISEVLATGGFLGAAIYLGFLILSLYFFLKAFLRGKLSLSLLAVFFALIISQFFYYQNSVLAFVFWLFLGLIVASRRKDMKERVFSFKEIPEVGLIGAVLVIVLGVSTLAGLFFAGKFYLADMSYESAFRNSDISGFEKAARLNPYQPSYKINLSRAYLGAASRLAGEGAPKEEVNGAIVLSLSNALGGNGVVGAVQLSPNSVAAQENLGALARETLRIQGSLGVGMQALEKAVWLEPASPFLHTELGKLYIYAGMLEEAKEHFVIARQLKPDYIEAFVRLVDVFEFQGDIETAKQGMENLEQAYPNSPEVIFQVGRLYLRSGDSDKAIAKFNEVLQIASDHINARYFRGVAYEEKGDIQTAISIFEALAEDYPDNEIIQDKLSSLMDSGSDEE